MLYLTLFGASSARCHPPFCGAIILQYTLILAWTEKCYYSQWIVCCDSNLLCWFSAYVSGLSWSFNTISPPFSCLDYLFMQLICEFNQWVTEAMWAIIDTMWHNIFCPAYTRFYPLRSLPVLPLQPAIHYSELATLLVNFSVAGFWDVTWNALPNWLQAGLAPTPLPQTPPPLLHRARHPKVRLCNTQHCRA